MLQTKELGPYLFKETLGQGTFAKVKLAQHKPTGELVAIKVLNKSKITDVADVERINREIHILKLVRHCNIVQLYEIIETPKHLFFVMEYCEEGELFKHIVNHGKLTETQACKLYEQLISGLEYLHKLHISHRDLKTENLLMDYNMSLKIVDFGLANTYTKEETLRTPCGSQVYAAPEILQGEHYNGEMVDIWSSGIILFAMVCGYLPFQDDDPLQLTKKILNEKCHYPSHVSSDLRDLIDKILTKDPLKRSTIEKIRSHPWMNKNINLNSNRNKGIVVGYNKIPIDQRALSMMGKDYNPEYVSKCLEANRHNGITTTYYLTLKKYIRNGGNSLCDLSSSNFNSHLLKSESKKKASKVSVQQYKSILHEHKPRVNQNKSVFHENKENIPLNNEKIQIEFNRKSVSKKSSVNLNHSHLNGVLYTKDSSTATINKVTRHSRLNDSLAGRVDKSCSYDRQDQFSHERVCLTKKNYPPRVEKKKKRESQSNDRNKSVMVSQSHAYHPQAPPHQRQKSSIEIKKKLNQSFKNRNSLNLKKRK